MLLNHAIIGFLICSVYLRAISCVPGLNLGLVKISQTCQHLGSTTSWSSGLQATPGNLPQNTLRLNCLRI